MQRSSIAISTKQSNNRHSGKNVCLIFALSFAVHTALNLLLIKAPTITIDEGLYTNIARSLTWEGELAFRAQPVHYPYLLYPFLLVPLYRLNALLGGDVYRYVQVFNTLLITSSVCPAYLFAKDFTKSERTAVMAAILVALMPDMVMGGFEMTEALIWPLTFWMVFLCYRYFAGHKIKYGILAALFCGLMFCTKPGAVAVGAVMLTAQACIAPAQGKKERLRALLPLAVIILVVVADYAVCQGLFHSDSSLLGLYEKQTSEWVAKDVLVAAEATILLVFLFVFACGGIFAILPFAYLKQFDIEKRRFILAFSAGLFAAILGTAVFVVPFRWDGSLGALPLHLRYIAMYVPAFFVFSSDMDLPAKAIGKGKKIKAAILVFAAFSVFPGARAGFVKDSSFVDSVMLSAFYSTKRLNAAISGWIVTLIVFVFAVILMGTVSKGWRENLKRTSTAYLLFLVVINSLCAHINANVFIDPTILTDALEVKQLVGKREALGISQRYYDDIYSYCLDSRLNYPMQQVTIDQMFVKTEEEQGVYVPFVPIEQPPNVNNRNTPDTDTFVLGMTIAEHLELSDNTTPVKTENEHFTVVKITPGVRWVDSMMYGMDDNRLFSGTTAMIEFFDDSRNVDGMIHMSVTASGKGSLKIGNQMLQLSNTETKYDIVIPFQKMITITAMDGTAQIISYQTERGV